MQCLLFRWCWVKCDELRCSRIAIAQQIGAKSCLILPGKEINMQTINGAHPVAVVMHRDSDLSIHEHLVVTWSHIGDLWPAQSPLNLEPGLLCQKKPSKMAPKEEFEFNYSCNRSCVVCVGRLHDWVVVPRSSDGSEKASKTYFK